MLQAQETLSDILSTHTEDPVRYDVPISGELGMSLYIVKITVCPRVPVAALCSPLRGR
jgi:hypothetical protein